MEKISERMFPNGIPALITVLDLSELLGVSRPQAQKLVDAHPEMTVVLDGSKVPRVKSQLYFDVIK